MDINSILLNTYIVASWVTPYIPTTIEQCHNLNIALFANTASVYMVGIPVALVPVNLFILTFSTLLYFNLPDVI